MARLDDGTAPTVLELPDFLDAVLAKTRAWENAHPVRAVRDRVAARVRPFLGARATDRLVGSALPEGEDLLARIEPVLALFLGRQAADRLVTHVLVEL
jgi:hypothetical protein